RPHQPGVHAAAVSRLRRQRPAPAAVERAVLRLPDGEQRAAVLRPGRVPRPRPAPAAARRGPRRRAVPALRLPLGGGMIEFLSGAITMGYLAAGGFFARFWRKTADRLFLVFALAFVLL